MLRFQKPKNIGSLTQNLLVLIKIGVSLLILSSYAQILCSFFKCSTNMEQILYHAKSLEWLCLSPSWVLNCSFLQKKIRWKMGWNAFPVPTQSVWKNFVLSIHHFLHSIHILLLWNITSIFSNIQVCTYYFQKTICSSLFFRNF